MALKFLNDGYFAAKVGIGTETPAARLHINPTTPNEIAIAINGTQNYSAGQFHRIAAGDANSVNRLSIGFGYDNPTDWAIRYSSYGRHEFYTGNDWGNAANTEKMVITSAGNVGIGTGSPDGNLEIVTSAIVSGASDTVNNVLIGLQAANRPTIILDTADTTYTNRTWNITNVGSAGKLFIGRNGLDVMVMDNSGKVGIGTDSPSSILELSATTPILTLNSTAVNVAQGIEWRNSGTLDAYIKQGPSTAEFEFNVGRNTTWGGDFKFVTDTYDAYRITRDQHKFFILGSAKMTINSSGNVGIGTTSPTRKFVVSNGGASGIEIEPNYVSGVNEILSFNRTPGATAYETMRFNGGDFQFQTSGSEKMRITSAGGISFGSTGTAYGTSGQVLTSAGNASPTWTTPTTGTVTGGGSNTYLAKWTTATNINSSAMFQAASGNFSIGITTPNAKLSVVNDISIGTSATDVLRLSNISGVGGIYGFGSRNLAFGSITNGEVMRVDNINERVGIGTTSPDAKLDVIGQGIFQGSTTSSYKGANVGTLNINNNSADGTVDFTQGLVFTDNVTNQGSWTHAGIVSVGSTGYNGSLVFGTDGDGVRNTSGITEKMRITSGGRVGIGTTNPTANLHVYTSTNSSTIEVGRGAGRSSIKASADADGGYLALDSSGNGLILNHYSSDNVWLVTGGGNVGVGTTGPSQKLHVSGNARVTGAYYDSNNSPGTANQVLVSTATGTDWVDGSGSSIIGGPYLPLAGGTMTGVTQFNDHTQHGDQVQARWGASNDFTIEHNATDSSITNITGDLYITNKADDKDIVFRSDDGSGGFTTYFKLDGSTEQNVVSKNMRFEDSIQAQFGAGTDLRIYHDGSNSYINETGTGSLVLKTGALLVRNPSDASMLDAQSGGAINLYYNGSKKFETTNTGVTVTGNITVGDGHFIGDDNFDNLLLQAGGTGNLENLVLSASNDLIFYTGGTTPSAVGTERLRIYNSDGRADFAGVLSLPDGSAGAPAISNTGDANTGMYWPGDHQVGFTVNNSRKFYIAETKAYFQNLSSGVEINAGGIDVTGDSTFVGQVNITSSGAAHFGITNTNVSGSSQQYLQYVGSNGDYVFRNATDSTTPLFLAKNNNATFAGDINLAAGKKLQYSANSFMTPENNVSGAEISTAGTFIVKTGTTPTLALTLNASQNATFSAKAYGVAPITSDPDSTIATKGYVQSLITGATIYRGTWDPDVSLNSGYGNPNLNTVTQTSGYYYICSADGAATPNGATTEPNTWNTGDWVIWNDDIGTSGEWQKIDNSSVLSGVGTGQTVALWQGASSVTDSETLGNAPITVSGNNSTFAGDVVIDDGVGRLTLDSTSGTNRILSTTTGFGTYELLELRAEAYEFKIGTTEKLTIDGSGNATFAGQITTTQNQITTDIGTTSAIRLKPAATTDSGGKSSIFLGTSTADNYGISLRGARNSGAGAPTFELATHNNSNNGTVALSIDNSQNATFSGTIGIGTAPTTNAIEIDGADGTSYIYLKSSAATTGARVGLNSDDLIIENKQASGDMIFDTNSTERMRITSAGNVGIGTTLPNSYYANANNLVVGSHTGSNGISILAATNQTGWLVFADSTASGDSTRGAIAYDHSNNSMSMRVNNDTKMRIDSSGNVGIGTTSPASKLHIDSNSNSTYPSGFRDGELRIANDNSSNVANQTSSIVLSATGWAGSSTGVAQLSVIQDGSNISNGTFTIKVRDNGTHSEAFRIKYNGNVGIGTTSPNSKLDVRRSGSGVALELHQTSGSANDYVDLKMIAGNTNAGTFGTILRHKRDGSGGGDFSILTNPTLTGTPTEKLIVKSGGNVGIGTTSPQSKLQVAGGIQMADDTATASAAKVGTMRYRTGTEYVDVTGAELVVNGDFATTATWTTSGTVAISGGTANWTNAVNGAGFFQAITFTANAFYRCAVTISNYSSGTFRFRYPGISSPRISANGTYSFIIEADLSINNSLYLQGEITEVGGNVNFSVDDVSVIEVVAEDASYADMCMQTGSSTYEWVNIVRNTY
jgi:hypothetical protein